MMMTRLDTARWARYLLAAAVAVLAGCQSAPKRDPEFAVAYPAYREPPPQRTTGSIYASGHDVALFEDLRARRVGDVLTIRLVESTNASKSASSTLERSQRTDVANPTLLGTTPQFDVPSALPLAATRNRTFDVDIDSDNEFEGEGEAEQSNSLSGDLSVTVADVLPNGNLLVRGEKRLNLNQGNEYVKISGIVRPVDIAVDNSVPSTKVADATIIYNGDGAVADSSKIGWLARFFVSALFPF